jgi:8-oxo-dGTP diphosphatase
MTGGQRHSVSVAAVIVDGQGQALVIQRRDNGRWEPPAEPCQPRRAVQP